MRDMAQGNELEDEREHEVRLESPIHDSAPAHATGAPAPSTNPEADYRRPWCARTKHKVRPHQAQGAPAPSTRCARTKHKVRPHLCQVCPHQALVRPHQLRRIFTMRQKTQVRSHLLMVRPHHAFRKKKI